MKVGVPLRPDASGRHHPPSRARPRERWTTAACAIGALVRNADLAHDPESPVASGRGRGAAVGRLRPAAQCSDASEPADAVQRTRCACSTRQPLQQARARRGCARRVEHAATPFRAGASTASPASIRFLRPLVRSTPSSRSRARRIGVMSRSKPSIACPATRRLSNLLAPGDLIVALRLPASSAAFAPHARYLKLRERTSYAFALVSAAAGLRHDDGKITDARLALGRRGRQAMARA